MVKQSVESSFHEMGNQVAREAEYLNPASESQSLQDLSDHANGNNDDDLGMEFDKNQFGEDISKMAVIISDEEVMLEVCEGQ